MKISRETNHDITLKLIHLSLIDSSNLQYIYKLYTISYASIFIQTSNIVTSTMYLQNSFSLQPTCSGTVFNGVAIVKYVHTETSQAAGVIQIYLHESSQHNAEDLYNRLFCTQAIN